MPVYFISSQSIQGQTVALPGDLVHHFRDVLRCKPGETFRLVDENQTAYAVAINQVTPAGITAEILSTDVEEAVPGFSTIIAQALVKGKKMDWVIQKGTELGMDALIPVITDRSVPRPNTERAPHQLRRWGKIAREAAQQCGRRDIPEIRAPLTLPGLLDSRFETMLRLFFWEKERTRSLKSVLRDRVPGKGAVILVGPEGGFSDEEMESIINDGWIPVSLGKRTLRTETAALAALFAVQYEWGEDTSGEKLPEEGPP
ncbi:MAG TPA: 16S rRNA (uracil(1498)-N(3))-methyltransferase [Nitrospiria bacterium]|nr:16S rRNA (uracil(1498)-N(3))-methyltransferase [Nitrospiria bacterium]